MLYPSQTPARRGFSLVETVIAVGIATFVLVACVGILSVGLKMNKQSRELIVSSEIATFLGTILQTEAATGHRPVDTNMLPIPFLTNVTQDISGQYQADQRGLKSATPVFDVQYFVSRPDKNLGRVHLVLSSPAGAPPQSQEHHEANVSVYLP